MKKSGGAIFATLTRGWYKGWKNATCPNVLILGQLL